MIKRCDYWGLRERPTLNPYKKGCVWWHMLVIPLLVRWGQAGSYLTGQPNLRGELQSSAGPPELKNHGEQCLWNDN